MPNPMGFMRPRETFAVAIPGQEFSFTMMAINPSPVKILNVTPLLTMPDNSFRSLSFDLQDSQATSNNTYRLTRKISISAEALYSKPYAIRNDEIREHTFNLRSDASFGLPFPAPRLMAHYRYRFNDVSFEITRPVQTAWVAAPYGEQRRLLTIAPAINIQMTPRVGIVALNAAKSEATVNVSVSSNAKSKADGKVKLRVPAGWNVTPAEQPFSFAREGEKSNFTFTVAIPKLAAKQDYKIQAVAEYNGKEYTEGYEVIAHRDLEPRHLYRNAEANIRGVDVAVAPNLHVGYVMGVGDKVPEALAQIGVKVSMLGANELATGNLEQFDAVVIGIRASAVREDLKAYNKRLLEYVERGGNVVWQYQTPEFDEAAYGPFPYKMGRNPEEVSEEDARVTLLDATNPIFNFPNKISAKDFDNWVEERGSKWWGEWDARYKPLLEAHDREQPLQKGGMMYAEYGKGTWMYAGYAFYRQLPAGVEGAYRLFANLISLKKRTR
jgi:hypothetical protein